MKRISLAFLGVLFLSSSCSDSKPLVFDNPAPLSAPVRTPGYSIDDYTLPTLPDWTWAFQDPGDIRYFDLEKLMVDFGMSRYEAVEVQNGYRDLTRPHEFKAIPQAEKERLFQEALDKVKNDGSFEKSLDVDRIKKADFVVIFDLDNTLYDQHLKSDDVCPEIQFDSAIAKKKIRIKLVPGWEDLINAVHKMGGTSVLFTAWIDHLTRENLEHWQLDGKPILQSPKISGLLSHSHLTMDRGNKQKSEEPRAKRSKDIRIVDETLEKAILVDNNPTLVFQFRNLRVVSPFKGAYVCDPIDAVQSDVYSQSLPNVRREIEESVQYMKANWGTSFATAFLPYTELGKLTVQGLLELPNITPELAREKIRKLPTLVPNNY